MNETSLAFHRHLYAAIRDRDPNAARRHILDHLAQAEQDVLRVLDPANENGQPTPPGG